MIPSSIVPRDRLLNLSSCPNLDLSVGYRQIKLEPTIFIMLSYSWLFLEHTPLHPLVWPILSHCSHNGGSPVIWKFRWVAIEPISSILSPPWFMLNIELVLELLQALPLCLAHEVYVWVKEVTFSKFTCIRCKLPPWIWERIVLFPMESSQVSHAFVRSILWFGRLITSTPYVFCSTPSHWLICSRRRSSFLRVYLMQGLRYPWWWFPTRT